MLLLWTGARKSEVMGMRWRDLDLDLKGANGGQATWNRRAADLKGRRNHTLPLSKDARALLLTIHAEQTKGRLGLPEFVFFSAAKPVIFWEASGHSYVKCRHFHLRSTHDQRYRDADRR
jgi:integrase